MITKEIITSEELLTKKEERRTSQRKRLERAQHQLPWKHISNLYSGLKVLGLVADRSACGGYRVLHPLHLLSMHGAKIEAASSQNLQAFLNYDIIIAPRQHSPEVFEVLNIAAWEGKVVIYEIDDDLDSVLESSTAYMTYHKGSKELTWVPKFIQAAHGLTTTTPEIVKWYGAFNVNTRVIENYIDFSLRDWNADVLWEGGSPIIRPKPIKRPAEWEGKTVIMWSGGSTHRADIQLIGPAIKQILQDYKDTIFVVYSSIDLLELLVTDFDLPKDRVYHIEARHFTDHPGALHGADIGLAPIVGCQFNVCKSTLKILETLSTGATCVASNVGPYARFNRRHPDLICTVGQAPDSHRSWYEALAFLIENPDIRRERAVRGRKLMADEYSMEANIHLWPAAWRSIIENIKKGIVGPPEPAPSYRERRSWATTLPNDPCPCESGLRYKACCRGAWG